MPISNLLHDMNFEKNNSLNVEAFLFVYTREMVKLLGSEVCEAPLKKSNGKRRSWSDGLEFGLCFPLNIQKQLKR